MTSTAPALLDRFLAFLDASPSPSHAVASTVVALEARGWHALDLRRTGHLQPGSKTYVVQGGTIFAVHVGTSPAAAAGFRIVAAHTDSPNLRIKPQPLIQANGWVRLGLEPYGGVQLATWVDRDLGVAGAVHLRDGDRVRTALVDVRRPVCRIPTLAIHLNRGVNDDGLKLNAQTQLPAVFAQVAEGGGDPLRSLLATELGCAPGDVLTWDLGLFDLSKPTLGGAHGEFVFSGRLDNLASCHAGLEAMLASDTGGATQVLALFDHEEIGSRSSRGADSRAIETVLGLVCGPADLTAALANTWLLSADMSHGLHPGFADKSEPEHAPKLNGGPAIKQNVNVRYTTEGLTAAAFAVLCERAEVPYQWYVHRSDLACGSTVGPMLSSRLGVRSVDVGNPMLSMHSAREQCGAHDHERMVKVMARFFTDDLPA
jgi:aspartyl aminopeptidase